AASGDASEAGTGLGLGLAFLRERAASLDGSLEIASDSDGTHVRMSIPRVIAALSSGLDPDGTRTGVPDAATS
ncbi:MAG TPA: hypothetical protein VNJ04_21545, partial [Gemmatimonadaceae bacterium]|nr:hypothetical protein [Gemmatimonadaceae bacterium]